jgi:hypothetical protein
MNWAVGVGEEKPGVFRATVCVEVKATAYGLGEGLHPTLRKVREGWGTRVFVAGGREDGGRGGWVDGRHHELGGGSR